MVAWLSCCNCARVSIYDNNKARLGLYFADANFGYSMVSLTSSSILVCKSVGVYVQSHGSSSLDQHECMYIYSAPGPEGPGKLVQVARGAANTKGRRL
ncbi:hypothetical protein OH76DRAFT_839907 [Lentinus brumalis]|uniref:Uncharacterized protein n=1 Tax=Lentinus brumalis TaxID=2498619 RepID=A0A371D1M2_9APHY|nr:hypothetical protein OH76DRAFT_839907 [Polyporus brumalis]